MPKRKATPTKDDRITPPASSTEFSSLISKFSYSETALNDVETKSSSSPPVTPPKSSRTKKARAVSASPSNSQRNPGYAPPSAYSHLPTPDLDCLADNLILLFIGLNPGFLIQHAKLTLFAGVATALANHCFAGATNKFWPLLHSSGITTLRHTFHADKSLPSLYRVGVTNLIPRPTRCASELSKEEMLSQVDVVEDKIRMYKPSAVCVVGKGIWDVIYERKHFGTKVGKDFKFGWQPVRMGVDERWEGARCFVTPSTSGRVAAYSREFQEILWKELGAWVQQERGDIKEEVETNGTDL